MDLITGVPAAYRFNGIEVGLPKNRSNQRVGGNRDRERGGKHKHGRWLSIFVPAEYSMWIDKCFWVFRPAVRFLYAFPVVEEHRI